MKAEMFYFRKISIVCLFAFKEKKNCTPLKKAKILETCMVPVNKQSNLRPLATVNQVNKCISILKSKPKIKRSMWSRRAQEYEQ